MPLLTSGLFRITLRKILLLRVAGILVLLIAIGTFCTMTLMHAAIHIQSVAGDTLTLLQGKQFDVAQLATTPHATRHAFDEAA